MGKNVINFHEFTSKLNKYKATLHEMDKLTDKEIERVSSLGTEMAMEGNLLDRQTAIFMHYQVNLFLKELGELVNDLPLYSLPKDTFLIKEIKSLVEQALTKLKELSENEEIDLSDRFKS